MQEDKQLRYTIILDIIQYIFSGLLTLSVIIFCAVQLIRLPPESSNIYVTVMVGLVLVWVPVKNIKSKITKKLADKMASSGNDVLSGTPSAATPPAEMLPNV